MAVCREELDGFLLAHSGGLVLRLVLERVVVSLEAVAYALKLGEEEVVAQVDHVADPVLDPVGRACGEVEGVGGGGGIAFGGCGRAAVDGRECCHVGVVVGKPCHPADVVGKPRAHLADVDACRLLCADGALVEILLAVHFEAQRGGAVGHLPRAHAEVVGQGEGRAFVVVAHHVLEVLDGKLSLGLDVEREHLAGRVAHCIGEIGSHVFGSPLVVVAPDACLAVTQCSEVSRGVCL